MITETQSSFKRDGSYDNQFDEFGNLIIVDTTEKYFAVMLTPEVYENSSVTNVYDIEISEFKDVVTKEDPAITTLKSEKTTLQTKLKTLTAELSKMSNSSGKDALIAASKDTIISLRIKAGEGKSASDFNTVFPYLPLKSQDAIQSDASSTGLGSQTSTSTTTVASTTQTDTPKKELTGEQQGLIPSEQCVRQQDIQLSPPLEFSIPAPATLKPVTPVAMPQVVAPPIVSVPVHQLAVQKVVAAAKECKELFYKYGKYDNIWPTYGVGKSPLMYAYGVYSDNVTESWQTESSDTLNYQVYFPYTGTYTLKFCADNSGYFAIDGVRHIDLTNVNAQSPYDQQLAAYQDDHPKTIQLTEGWKNVDLFYKNWGGPHSVAAVIIYDGRIIWTSRYAYNQKDYNECRGPEQIALPSEDCVNPISIFKFQGNVDHTLRITLQSDKVTYSNEVYHGTLPRVVSQVSNNGVGPYNTDLKLKWTGRGDVKVSQQPNSTNNYTAIIDIFDGKGGEGTYNVEVLQLKCSRPAFRPKQLNELNTVVGAGGGGGVERIFIQGRRLAN